MHQKQRLFNTTAGRCGSWQRTDLLSVQVHTALYLSILPANILVFDVRRDWYYEVSTKGMKFPLRLSSPERWQNLLFRCVKQIHFLGESNDCSVTAQLAWHYTIPDVLVSRSGWMIRVLCDFVMGVFLTRTTARILYLWKCIADFTREVFRSFSQ